MNILLLLVANFACILAIERQTTLGLIPEDIICPFCIALIEKFQQTARQNSTYKEALCESVSARNQSNYDSCLKSFDEMTEEKLKVSSAEELCKKQKICPVHHKGVMLLENTGKADFPFIPAVTKEQIKNAEKFDTLKTIADILTGKLEYANRKNLTLHIDMQFQKLQVNEENSTTSLLTEINGTN